MKSLFLHFTWIIAFSLFSTGNAYSWPGMPYPFRGPSGEIIMGLGLIGDMEPTSSLTAWNSQVFLSTLKIDFPLS